MMTFPTLSEDFVRQRLEPPSGKVRVVFDTDTANEIDDQFALAWALLSPDEMDVEAVYAEPYSFQYRLDELRQAYDIQQSGRTELSVQEQGLLNQYGGQLERIANIGGNPHDLTMDDPATGVEKSYQEIKTVYEKLGLSPEGKAFRGSPRYLPSLDEPIRSESTDDLIERALATPEDEPLYVVAIGCVTNIASALLIEPEIIKHIVVTWTAGYPTNVNQVNYSFNLEQDLLASQLLFDCGVPLVYLPGFHIGAQLRLSLPEMEMWVKSKGAIGDYLYHLYTHNPLYPFLGFDEQFGRTWVIWDLINVAWLLNPDWVPSQLLPAAKLGGDKRWHPAPYRHLIREAYSIDRDAIFRDFFTKLANAP